MSNCDKKSQLFSILTGLLYPAILGAVVYDAWKLFFFEIDKHPDSGSVALVIALIALYVVDFSYTVVRPDWTYSWKKFFGDCFIVFSLFFAIKLVFAGIPVIGDKESFKKSFPRLIERLPVVSDPIFWWFVTKAFSVYWEKQEAEKEAKEKFRINRQNFRRLFNNVFRLSCLCCKPVNKKVCGQDYNDQDLNDYGMGTDAAFMFAYLLLIIGGGCIWGFGNSWLDGSHPHYVWGLVFVVSMDALLYWQYDRLDKGLA